MNIKIRPRIIPVLLFKNSGLYKTIKFKNPLYVGDPVNTIRIFNEKEVDELIFLDISKGLNNSSINWTTLRDIASECFMPLTYGGGVNSIEMIREILNVGFEKVAINSNAVRYPILISKAAEYFGSSTVVVSIDVKKNYFGKYEVYINGGQENTKLDPVEWAKEVEQKGAGEIMINSIDHDGMMTGYDYNLIYQVTNSVNIPVIACGGARGIIDFQKAIFDCNVSAVGAGACFVYQGKHRAVLITYPNRNELQSFFSV